jgi:alanyl-tRNA synthetase
MFRILSDRALASGIRRIEAVALYKAIESCNIDRQVLGDLQVELKAPADRLLERTKSLKSDLKAAKSASAVAIPTASEVLESLESISDAFATKHFAGLDGDSLRKLSHSIGDDFAPKVILLTGGDDNNVPFCFLVSDTASFNAGSLAKQFGKLIRGGGGGKPNFAQGKGSNGSELKSAVESLFATITS